MAPLSFDRRSTTLSIPTRMSAGFPVDVSESARSFVSGPMLWSDHAFENLGSRSHLLRDLRKLAAGIVTATGLLCGRAQERRECAAEHQRRHDERREQLVTLAPSPPRDHQHDRVV